MAKRLFLFIVAIAVIAVVALIIFLNNSRTVTPEGAIQQQTTASAPQASQALAVEASTSTVSESDSFYDIKAAYPQFVGVSTSINNEVSSFMGGQISDFKKQAKDNWDARNATLATGEVASVNPPQPFDFVSNWTPVQVNNQYISFVENIYFFAGGAHGINEVRTFNYDITQGKDITINDFLSQPQQSLQKLSQLADQKVADQLTKNNVQVNGIIQGMIQDGTQPTVNNYSNFSFTKDSLIIYFQQYQVAPGYLGGITITLTKSELMQAGITSPYMN